MVTIKQVAEEANVSKSTVSRYISQNGYVSVEASHKIKKAIEKLNFRPNVLARSLKTKKNQLVGLLLPDISNPFFPRLARGVEEYLKDRGYRVMLGNIGENSELVEEYLQILIASSAAGIITTHDFTKKYPDLEIPVVVVDRVSKKTEYGVFSDNQLGGQIAAEEIYRGGTNNVLLIRGPLDRGENIGKRFEASYLFLKTKQVNVTIYESMTFDFETIQIEAKNALDNHPLIDSIIAPSDIHAIAYIHELLSRGKKVPSDVQIIGYDDVLLSQFIYPSLSTIHQSSYSMGQKAAELVYHITNELPVVEKRIKIPVYYVERETVRRKHE